MKTTVPDTFSPAAHTIMVVEVSGSTIPWMEPRDLSWTALAHRAGTVCAGLGKWPRPL